MSNSAPTIQDVLEAINDYATHNDVQIKEIKTEIGSIKTELTSVKSQMVTKTYLDEKLSDLRGDLTVLMRKEDTKLKALVEILAEKKVLSSDDAKKIFSLEPFPQLAL